MNRNLRDGIDELIRRARRILLVAHVAPDGDAIGSLLGLGWLLKAQGKDLTLTCEDPVPDMYAWLPASAEIARQASGSYDLIIALDCSDERRMGRVFGEDRPGEPLLNIDHHITNTRFGTINWVDPATAATSQMVLNLAEALGWALTEPAATCLLNGLVADTRSFRTSNVDAATMRAALQLMEAGAPLYEITRRALDERPLASVRLWGQAVDRLRLEDGILWTEVTAAMRRQWSLDEGDNSGLANFLSGIREAKVVIVFTERHGGTVDVSMRCVPGYDVAEAAVRLGGGGHRLAAGCTLEDDLSRARERVLAEVRRSLAEQPGTAHT
jgi:phosphoesterase RecJ-like protein